MSEYSKWFWDNCDELNKDTSFAHRLAERAWNHKDKEVKELQSKLERVLGYLEGESADRWGLWKEGADMMDQGASNAYEDAYWFVKNIVEEKE